MSRKPTTLCGKAGCRALARDGARYCEYHKTNFQPRPCKIDGCRRLSRDGSGYCESHKPSEGTRWAGGSRHERGYGTEWDKIRIKVLERDGWLCQCSQCRGGDLRVMAANEVNHIKPKAAGGSDDMWNLQAVSAACHLRITQEQRVAYGWNK